MSLSQQKRLTEVLYLRDAACLILYLVVCLVLYIHTSAQYMRCWQADTRRAGPRAGDWTLERRSYSSGAEARNAAYIKG